MLPIRNSHDLRAAYEYRRLFEDHLRNCPPELLAPGATESLRLLKEQIRAYTHQPPRKEILVRDYGIDGYIIRFPLPAWIRTKEDAEEYFEEYCYMRCRPTMYDCTGDLFTAWYKVYRHCDRWWAYHSIGCDV